MKVYVTHAPIEGLDFSKAERWGEIIYLLQGKVNIYRPAEVADAIEIGLSAFETEDYLILAGNSLAIFFAGMYLPEVPRLQLLVWDQREKDYVLRTVET